MNNFIFIESKYELDKFYEFLKKPWTPRAFAPQSLKSFADMIIYLFLIKRNFIQIICFSEKWIYYFKTLFKRFSYGNSLKLVSCSNYPQFIGASVVRSYEKGNNINFYGMHIILICLISYSSYFQVNKKNRYVYKSNFKFFFLKSFLKSTRGIFMRADKSMLALNREISGNFACSDNVQ